MSSHSFPAWAMVMDAPFTDVTTEHATTTISMEDTEDTDDIHGTNWENGFQNRPFLVTLIKTVVARHVPYGLFHFATITTTIMITIMIATIVLQQGGGGGTRSNNNNNSGDSVGPGRTGVAVWNSALLLTRLLILLSQHDDDEQLHDIIHDDTPTISTTTNTNSRWIRNRIIVELECGTGLVSLACAAWVRHGWKSNGSGIGRHQCGTQDDSNKYIKMMILPEELSAKTPTMSIRMMRAAKQSLKQPYIDRNESRRGLRDYKPATFSCPRLEAHHGATP